MNIAAVPPSIYGKKLNRKVDSRLKTPLFALAIALFGAFLVGRVYASFEPETRPFESPVKYVVDPELNEQITKLQAEVESLR